MIRCADMTPNDIKALIRSIPDFPRVGIVFRDVTTLLSHGEGFAESVDWLARSAEANGAQIIVGVIIDDLMATGGTAEAAAGLVRRAGGVVDHALFVIDLPDLGGSGRLAGCGIASRALVSFEGH